MIKTNFDDLRRRKSMEEKRDISLRKVSGETGLSMGTIRRLSAGDADSYHTKTLEVLCKYFGCEIADLIELVLDPAEE